MTVLLACRVGAYLALVLALAFVISAMESLGEPLSDEEIEARIWAGWWL